MIQGITVLGATGSIGSSLLQILSQHKARYQVVALTANTDHKAMTTLCEQWLPQYAVMADPAAALVLAKNLKQRQIKTEVLSGAEALSQVASLDGVDVVMAAIVGAAGLLPTMAAVQHGKRILLANKEALVMSGKIFMDAVQQYGAQILPVDSEHNAIFQCLPEYAQQNLGQLSCSDVAIERILLTGSGGPLRDRDIATFDQVTPEVAVAHPNWSMGPKISVDSATMMNKGLEYIEAMWLFNPQPSELEIVIHPQSVIHSMVQFKDGSTLAQLGTPDMCTPIAHALAYPQRLSIDVKPLDFIKLGELSFLAPDFNRYPCLKLAIDAYDIGQHATTALNAANEVAVAAFLNREIAFTQIAEVNAQVLAKTHRDHQACEFDTIEALVALDAEARSVAHGILAGGVVN